MNFILTLGRNRFYPYVGIVLIMATFIWTDPITQFNWRYFISFIGAVTGLLCVILLAKQNNFGNILGMIAVLCEGFANLEANNLGAALPALIFFVSHIYGLITWHQHKQGADQIQTRRLNYDGIYIGGIFLAICFGLSIYLTKTFEVENSVSQLLLNASILGLALTAQFLLMARFAFNWYVWLVMNLFVIVLQIESDNPIIAVQYMIYLFNSLYGIVEWKQKRIAE